ncbi:MAG: hypothetical protein EBX52_06620, partial [Proteobacteria bacterium]|nr:hypothetical protein [Pseudomonadota bacterium]
ISIPMLRLRDEETADLLADFIDLYGTEVKGEGRIDFPTLEDQPEALLPLILNPHAHRGLSTFGPRKQSWPVVFLFRRARNAVRALQSRRHEFSVLSASIRKHLLALGREFVKSGSFEVEEDVFFLLWNELDSHPDCTGDFRQLLLDRRAEFYDKTETFSATGTRLQGSEPLSGIPCAGDPVEGPVLCIGSSRPFLETRPETAHKILIARSLDSGWWNEILSAKGVVMEDPSPVSPAAILCREFDIPCVSGVADAVSRMKSGTRARIVPQKGLLVPIDS